MAWLLHSWGRLSVLARTPTQNVARTRPLLGNSCGCLHLTPTPPQVRSVGSAVLHTVCPSSLHVWPCSSPPAGQVRAPCSLLRHHPSPCTACSSPPADQVRAHCHAARMHIHTHARTHTCHSLLHAICSPPPCTPHPSSVSSC